MNILIELLLREAINLDTMMGTHHSQEPPHGVGPWPQQDLLATIRICLVQ